MKWSFFGKSTSRWRAELKTRGSSCSRKSFAHILVLPSLGVLGSARTDQRIPKDSGLEDHRPQPQQRVNSGESVDTPGFNRKLAAQCITALTKNYLWNKEDCNDSHPRPWQCMELLIACTSYVVVWFIGIVYRCRGIWKCMRLRFLSLVVYINFCTLSWCAGKLSVHNHRRSYSKLILAPG